MPAPETPACISASMPWIAYTVGWSHGAWNVKLQT
jgi:hypothetical protein